MDKSDKDASEHATQVSACVREHAMRARRWIVLIPVVLIAVVLFLAVLPPEVYRDYAFICENTGSQKGYRQWCTGWRSGQWYRESHLEQFMRQGHPSELTFQWARHSEIGKSILGRSVSVVCGFPPRLNMILTRPAIFDRYVDTLDEAAKQDLYHVLVSADQEAIQAEEQKMVDMALARAWAFE